LEQKRVITVTDNGDLIAFLIFRRYKREPDTMRLGPLGVKEGFRRQGIMRWIFEHIFSRHPEIRRFICETRAENEPMNQLLHKLGFQIFGTKTVGKNIPINQYHIVRYWRKFGIGGS